MAENEGTDSGVVEGESFILNIQDSNGLSNNAYFEGVDIADVVDRFDISIDAAKQEGVDLAALLDTVAEDEGVVRSNELSAHYKVAESFEPDTTQSYGIFSKDAGNEYDIAIHHVQYNIQTSPTLDSDLTDNNPGGDWV